MIDSWRRVYYVVAKKRKRDSTIAAMIHCFARDFQLLYGVALCNILDIFCPHGALCVI